MEFISVSDPIIVIAIVIGSIVLFVSEKLAIDLVAFIVLVALLLTGLVPEKHILDGFSNPATMTVAAMFVLSAGLQRTGVVRWIAQQLHYLAGKSMARMSVVLMTACGFLSAFINNTATVAVLLPVTLRMSRERNISPTRFLMPLSFAAQFGGVCTLIGTTTNLLVSSIARDAGIEPISMFEFAKLGIICFVVGMVYMLFAARFLLEDRIHASDLTEGYRLQDYVTEMKVEQGSVLIGQTGSENELHEIGNVRILEIIRDGKRMWAPQASTIVEDDILLIRGDVDRVIDAASRLKMVDWAEGNLSDAHLKSAEVSLIEVMIPAGSDIIGRTLNQLDFYWRYHAAVLGVRRRGGVIHERVRDIAFKEGDTLLLQGHKDDLAYLDDERDFVMLQDLSTMKLKKTHALLSVVILCGVIVAAASGALSILAASFVGAIAMILTRCLKAGDVYEAIDLKVILLLAGLIPLGFAMQSTGTVNILVDYILYNFGARGPQFALGVMYILTMVLTALMSNNATAVLLAPIALAVADGFGVDPKPFLMCVTFAASTCFTTPVGYQTNTMIYAPGGYRYTDFIKVGLPLNVIFFALSVTLIPYIWPF